MSAATSAASPSPSSASPAKKPAKAPAAKIRLPGRVADYFISQSDSKRSIVGGIRQDAPEERRFADKQTHTRRVSTALDKAAADAAAVLAAAAANGTEGSLDGAAAIDAAAAASAASAAAAASATPAPVASRKPKSRTLWTPKVFDRFPRTDFPDSECPKEIELFCFPAAYEPGLMHPPESHTFILTEADGTRVFGSVLKVWEPLDETRLEIIERGVTQGWDKVDAADAAAALSLSPSSASRGSISSSASLLLYVPKCLVIVSHWPYFSQFDRFLNCLYKGISAPSESNPNLVPLERVICNFILETPLPPQGKFEVECRSFMNPSLAAWVNTSCPWGPHAGSIQAGGHSGAGSGSSSGAMTADKKFLFSRPPPNKLPLRDFPLGTLFRWLSLENILMLYSAVLTERRILFVSNHCHKLTIAAETITHLCCPFFWRHIYIPLLPARLSDFICAPMPYIVGILASYMPDSLMLDGTLVVNLDDNELTQSSGDPIAPLPPERYTALFRHLKKLVGSDPSQPYRGSLPLSDSEIESAFLKFQVQLLAKYRDYLEAPSEFVMDKFQKNRFVSEHPEGGLDKSAGKDASTGRALDGVGVQFLTEFMETQMFQCFVDDRYDQSSRGGAKMLASDSNLEILFFDEQIDAAQGKPASFLQDSTQNINPAARVLALEPNRDGLAKGATFKYPGGRVPVPLDQNLFGTPREVPDLAGDSTAVSGGASSGGGGGVAGGSKRLDMDRISMKFFTEKRLYSQHFHTLRLRSAKQDGAFNHIAAYFRASQSADEATIASNDRLVVPTIEIATKETGTTIDPAWQSLKKYVAEELSLFTESFKSLREEVCIPLYTSCSESEHRLKILFSEANILEAHAAKGKSVVERTKSASISAFSKYEQLKTQLTQASVVLQPSEISRIVQSQNESEDSRLDLDEAETSFQTIVREYETRMPQIIASIRSLNQERIVQLKSSLEAWVQSKRQVLLGLMQQLDKVSERVGEINAEKDLVSFSEGTTDFWTAARNTATAASVSPAPEETVDAATTAAVTAAEADATAATDASSSPMVVSVTMDASPSGPSGAPVSSITPPTSSPSPALATIGEGGSAPATLAVESPPPASAASASRLTVVASSPSQGKRPSTSVRSAPGGEVLCYPLHLWGLDGFERAALEAQTTRKVMKELIACMSAWYEVVDTKSKKIHGSLRALPELLSIPGIGSHQRAVWETLKNRALASSKSLGDFGLSMLKLVSALSLTKGELKMSIQRFREHRIKLEKEVQVAAEVRAKSFEKKERTARALQAYQKQQAANPTGGAAAGTQNGATAPLVPSGSFVAAAIAKQNAAAAAAAADSVSSPSHLGGHGLMSQKQLELQSSLFERLNREAKEAAHEHELNERTAMAVQRKHDICVARLLRLFEKKERNGQTELKRTFGVLAESWAQKILATERASDESLSQAVKKTQLVQDWQEFVEQTLKQQQNNAAATGIAAAASSSSAAAAPTTVSAVVASGSTSAAAAITAVDFSKCLGATGYVPVASLLQCSISWVRNISTLLAEMSAADDAEVKLLRKFAFKIRSCRANTTVASAAAAFETLLDRMADVTEDAARVGLDTAAPFSKLKSSLKSHAKAFDTKFADQEKALNKAVEERKAAHAAELRAAEALRVAREKATQAAAAPGDAPVKKGLFSSFMSTPLKDLQNKEAAAAKEAEKAAAATQEKEMGLLVATSKRATELRELLHEMQTVEHRRWISQSDLLTALLVKHALHLDKMQTLFHNYSERVVHIDVEADLAQFIHQNQQALKPPDYVYEDYSKYIDAVAQAASNKSAAAQQQQEEMITSPIPLPGSSFVFAKRIMTGSAHAHTGSMDKPAAAGSSPQVVGSRGRSVTSHAVTGPSGKPLPVLAAPSSRVPLHLPSATTSTGSVVRSVTAEEPSASSALQRPAAGKEESLSSRPVEHSVSTSAAPTAGAAVVASSAESAEAAAADSAHPEMSVSQEFGLSVGGRTRGTTVGPHCPPSTEPLEPNPNANAGGALAPAATEDEDVQDPETGAWVKHHVNAGALNESGVDDSAAAGSSAAASESIAESSLPQQPPALQTQTSMSEVHSSPSTDRPQLTAAEINSAFLSPTSVVSASSTSHASQEAAASQQAEQASAANAKLEEVAAHAQKQEDAAVAKVEAAEVAAAASVAPVESVVAAAEPVAAEQPVLADSAATVASAPIVAAEPVAESASSSAAAPVPAASEDASSASSADASSDSAASSAEASSILSPVAQLPPALPSSKPTPRASASPHAKPSVRPKGPAPTPPSGLTSESPKPTATPPSSSTPAPAAAVAAESATVAQADDAAASAAPASSADSSSSAAAPAPSADS